jgi:hypothetical protein
MARVRSAYKVLDGKADHLEDLSAYGKMLLR